MKNFLDKTINCDVMRRPDRISHLVVLMALIAANSPGQDTTPARTLAITSVNVVDVSATTAEAAVRKNQTVIVTHGRISDFGDAKVIEVPPDALTIDGSGKYLIPGLWDMHAHVLSPAKRKTFLPLYVTNGVTSVRDMGTRMRMDEVRRWRDELDAGTLIGPRLQQIAGPVISGPSTRFAGFPELQVSDPAEARRAVIARKQMGVDFIKVHNRIPRAAYFAIAEEARKQKLSFVGHVTEELTVAEAVEAGQRSIEHGRILLACSPLEQEIAFKRVLVDEDRTPFMLANMRIAVRARQTCSDERLQNLSRLFRSKDAWLAPTLVQGYAWQYMHNGKTPYPEWLKYMPVSFREVWKNGNAEFGEPTGEDFADAQANFDKTVEIVGAMHRARVNIMAGTDANGPFIGLVPGISLHSELALFVKAGFTPLEALRSATIMPALFLHMEETTGSIDRNKAADIVLIEGNPVDNIGNAQRVAAVIIGGRFYDRAALNRMLAEAAEEAARK